MQPSGGRSFSQSMNIASAVEHLKISGTTGSARRSMQIWLSENAGTITSSSGLRSASGRVPA